MANDTYIKLFRKCLDNDLFKEKPFDRWHAFEYLLLKAPRFPTTVVLKGHQIPLESGQWIVGEDKLANTFGWSRGKVRRFLDLLVMQGIIQKNGTPYGTLITIENYTFYQGGEPQGSTSSSTSNGTHKKKEKERERKYIAPQEPKSKAYQPFEDAPPSGGCEMPDEIREKLGGMFNA